MSVAWTTILIIALLLPGVFFFIGYSTSDRYTREIVKSSAVGDVGWAVFISIVVHLSGWGICAAFGFDLAANLKQFADYDKLPHWLLIDHLVGRILPISMYALATALVGLLLGWCLSSAVSRGLLPFLVTHKWIHQVKRSMSRGLVTAYVLTTTSEDSKALMYKGVLAEFYQDTEGKFVYVVLKNCSRYFMSFTDASPKTGEQLQLFKNSAQPERTWDFLQIEGENIANILFDPSPQIAETEAGTEALDRALKKLSQQMDELLS